MANSKKRCKECLKYFPADSIISLPAGKFCSMDHAIKFAQKKAAKQRELDKQWQKDFKEKTSTPRKAKEHLRKRSEWLSLLQDLVNQWVVHVRDKGKSCCTCGAPWGVRQMHAGHYRSVGACSELRFELTNIHVQCVQCNSHNSGMRVEYQDFIVETYGQDHLDWLDGEHKLLKELLPDNKSIKEQCTLWRKKIRDAGLVPRR